MSIRSVTSVRDAEHEPFRKSVRSRAAQRDLYGLDTGISQGCVKRRGELPGPVADQEPEVRGAIMCRSNIRLGVSSALLPT
jgi:hypothetical protein